MGVLVKIECPRCGGGRVDVQLVGGQVRHTGLESFVCHFLQRPLDETIPMEGIEVLPIIGHQLVAVAGGLRVDAGVQEVVAEVLLSFPQP